MTMKKHLIALSLLGAFSLGLLSGCGTPEDSSAASLSVPETASVPQSVQTESDAPAVMVWADGSYTGEALVDETGFRYTLTVTVTIEHGQITGVEPTCDSPENELYVRNAAEVVVPGILDTQGTENIDVKSGATLSSDALIAAVEDALSKAPLVESANQAPADFVQDTQDEPAAPPYTVSEGCLELLGQTFYYGPQAELEVQSETVQAQEIAETGVYWYSDAPVSGTLYGHTDLLYADFYYGELNDLPEAEAIDLGTSDPELLTQYRGNGMYDAVSSATEQKWRMSTANILREVEGGGGEILGVAGVGVAVDAALYAQAMVLSAAGATEQNSSGLLYQAQQLTLESDPYAPLPQFKTLRADGTYSALDSSDAAPSPLTASAAEVTTSTSYGTHQINLALGLSEDPDAPDYADHPVIGAILEDDTGARYGLKELENIWQNGTQLAVSVRASRYEALAGKSVKKITLLQKDAQPLTLDTNLFMQQLLDRDCGISAENAVYNPDGSVIKVTQSLPEGVEYQLAEVATGMGKMRSVLTPETDYTFDGKELIVDGAYSYNEYFLTFAEATGKYADVSVTVSILADATASIVDNRLVVAGNVTAADYIAAISAATIDGAQHRGGTLGSAIFNEDGTINFDAMYGDEAHGDAEVPLFPKGSADSYELTIYALGFEPLIATVGK